MRKNEKLSRKIASTLLTMSLVYSGGMFVPDKVEAADIMTFNPVQTETVSGEASITDDISITPDTVSDKNTGLRIYLGDSNTINADFTGSINIDVSKSTATTTTTALVVDAVDSVNATVSIKNDLVLKAAEGHYALLLSNTKCATRVILKVNPEEDKTVQLLGDVVTASTGGGFFQNKVELNLTNEASYLAGDLISGAVADGGEISLKLANGAVWYPASQNEYKTTEDGNTEAHLRLDGGVIDLYHSLLGKIRTSANTAETFTLKNISDNVSGANGTTFRISSDVMGVNNSGTGTADKVVLEGASGYSGDDKYYIQIVADPSLTSGAEVLAPTDKIVVATVDNNYMTSENTTIRGSKYVGAELDAGLTLIDVTPSIIYDSGAGGWIIDKITVENNASGKKGTALTLAEVGAATALNIASAWRADNNDLLRRMGDLRSSNDEAGVWVRVYGGKNAVVKGQQTDMSYKALQGGYDYQSNLKNGKMFTGFAVSHFDGDVSGSGTDGDVNSTMFGVYTSYVGDKGHFADLIVKYGRVNNDFNTIKETNRYGSDYGSNGFSITTEYGYRQKLKNNFYIEPQAELTYARIGSSDYTMSLNDNDGAKVYNDAFESLIGRIGFTLGQQQKQNNIYAKLSLAHEFQGDIATSASYGDVTRTYEAGGSDTWVEYGIGFNSKLSTGTNLYGEIEKTTGSIIKTKWRANVGLRYSF